MTPMFCTCGHHLDLHDDGDGPCSIVTCRCNGYEERD